MVRQQVDEDNWESRYRCTVKALALWGCNWYEMLVCIFTFTYRARIWETNYRFIRRTCLVFGPEKETIKPENETYTKKIDNGCYIYPHVIHFQIEHQNSVLGVLTEEKLNLFPLESVAKGFSLRTVVAVAVGSSINTLHTTTHQYDLSCHHAQGTNQVHHNGNQKITWMLLV